MRRTHGDSNNPCWHVALWDSSRHPTANSWPSCHSYQHVSRWGTSWCFRWPQLPGLMLVHDLTQSLCPWPHWSSRDQCFMLVTGISWGEGWSLCPEVNITVSNFQLVARLCEVHENSSYHFSAVFKHIFRHPKWQQRSLSHWPHGATFHSKRLMRNCIL